MLPAPDSIPNKKALIAEIENIILHHQQEAEAINQEIERLIQQRVMLFKTIEHLNAALDCLNPACLPVRKCKEPHFSQSPQKLVAEVLKSRQYLSLQSIAEKVVRLDKGLGIDAEVVVSQPQLASISGILQRLAKQGVVNHYSVSRVQFWQLAD